MSRRHANIWSHPSHYLVDTYTWPSDHFWLRYSKFHIWPWKFKVKVMSKVKPDGHIWGLKFNRYVCFSFHGNRIIFGWDTANSTFNLENSVMAKVKLNVHIWGREFNRYVCFSFRGNRTIFWLRYSKFHIWPWKFKVKVTTKIGQVMGKQWCQKWKKSLCASFCSHWWIQTGVTVRKRPIWVKMDDFFSHVTLQFDVWPWKTIGHRALLCYICNSSLNSHMMMKWCIKLDVP